MATIGLKAARSSRGTNQEVLGIDDSRNGTRLTPEERAHFNNGDTFSSTWLAPNSWPQVLMEVIDGCTPVEPTIAERAGAPYAAVYALHGCSGQWYKCIRLV